MSMEGLTDPVGEVVAEVRSSPANVATIAGLGLLMYAVVGPEKTLSTIGGVALGTLALGIYRHTTRAVSEEQPNPLALERHGSQIQTLIFDKTVFTQGQAVSWAKKHNFKATKVDVKEGTYRLRQLPPSQFARMRTIELAHGVKAVVGFKN